MPFIKESVIMRVCLYLFTLAMVFIVAFVIIFSSPSWGAAPMCRHQCDPLDDPPICSGNWVQTCQDCNGDQMYEWCNTTNCSASGQVCSGGICQAASCIDNDGDGYGNPGNASCANGAAADCNDSNASINPGVADNNCNGIDENCSGANDEGYVPTSTSCGIGACTASGQNICQAGTVVNTCSPKPAGAEGPFGNATCTDGIDNDCDNLTDGADPNCANTCADNDGDGYGNPGNASCAKGAAADCNDSNASINPGVADNNCNGIDENCSGANDEGYVPTSTSCGIGACTASGQNICQAGTVVNTCSPNLAGAEGPFGNATCTDGIDNDCDNLTDGADPNCANTCADNDGDGYGNPGNASCANGAATDCNDNNPAIYPGAPEICGSGVDNNCDGNPDNCPIQATMLLPLTDNIQYQTGDSLLIRVQAVGSVNWINAFVQYPDETNIVTLSLYDDGFHNDGALNDNVWGSNQWIVTGALGTYYIDLQARTIAGYDTNFENIRNFEVIQSGSCNTIVNNGPSANKLDIVIIGDDYLLPDMTTFANNAVAAKNYFLTIPPFNTQSNKINFHRIDNTTDLKCANNCTGIQRLICCNYPTVYAAASACPYDQIWVLYNSSNYGGSAAYYGKIAIAYNGLQMKKVIVHEFGHSFATLYDEYYTIGVGSGGAFPDADKPNCDGTAGCPRWVGIPGTVCLLGCKYDNWYRSINQGIMKVLTTTDFGVVNINRINNLLSIYP